MTNDEKRKCLKKWVAKFPYIKPYVALSDEVLKYTSAPAKLCESLVKDYCVCNALSSIYKYSTSMLPAADNMYKHSDIRVIKGKEQDKKTVSIDTKYPSWNFSKSSVMWFEVDKNKASKADKLMYVGPDGYCWILDRQKSLEALASKKPYAGKSGDTLCNFTFDELAECGAVKELKTLVGVFNDVDKEFQNV